MNIGFHYYVSKTLAVKAGFPPKEAQLISYACQYVDDAVYHRKMTVRDMPEPNYERMGKNWFDPTCTAHRGIRNILYNFAGIRKKILLPFHFVPRGWDKETGEFDYVTVPEPSMSRQSVEMSLKQLRRAGKNSSSRTIDLIRLGVALHGYEDSFAHQGFSARNNETENGVSERHIVSNNKVQDISFLARLKGFLGYSIGHGLLYTFPDRFNTRIRYRDGQQRKIHIDTIDRFTLAAYKTYNLLREYTGKPDRWKEIESPLRNCFGKNWENKTAWNKTFSLEFPGMNFRYSDRTWKNKALYTAADGTVSFRGDMKWFYFHQAAYEYRQYMIENLPE